MTANDLNLRQKQFVQTLLTSRSAREAARRCGIGEKTAYRWLRLPQVQAALAEAESEALTAAMRRLLALQDGAVDALEDLINQRGLSPFERLRAVQAVFDNLLRLRGAASFEARLAEIERRIERLQEIEHGQGRTIETN